MTDPKFPELYVGWSGKKMLVRICDTLRKKRIAMDHLNLMYSVDTVADVQKYEGEIEIMHKI